MNIHRDKVLCPELQPVLEVHRNPWFTVNDRGGYFTTEPNTSQVAILPVIDEEHILMVKAKRPVIGDVTWELPAGGCNENESPLSAACRELKEEAGIGIDDSRFIKLPSLSVCPNRYPSHPHIFQAKLTLEEFDKRHAHDDEIEEIKLFSLEDIRQMLVSCEIYVALPCVVLSRYLLSFNKKAVKETP